MLGLVIIALLGSWALYQKQTIDEIVNDVPAKVSEKLDQLWSVAQESLVAKKYLRAEKALLTILRVDERNASAYNRLGILYAKQKEYKEAIECFEIAQSLEPSASSLHNVGLIYFETENYDKAALAFEQALAMDSEVPSRHIAYAKVLEKFGNSRKVIESLEQAARLEPSAQHLTILADALERGGETERAVKLREHAARLVLNTTKPVAKSSSKQVSAGKRSGVKAVSLKKQRKIM